MLIAKSILLSALEKYGPGLYLQLKNSGVKGWVSDYYLSQPQIQAVDKELSELAIVMLVSL